MLSEYLIEKFQINENIVNLVLKTEREVASGFSKLDEIAEINQLKVLRAFQKNNISDGHFNWNTGYGYDDPGREALERVYSHVFNTESSLVRPIIVNGTHALALMFSGILRPGDELLYCSGAPYDTLHEVIGIRGEGMGSLKDFGILYEQVDLKENGTIDFEGISGKITENTKVCALQRATGYAFRKAITLREIKEWASFIKSINKDIILAIDNCYGEFLDITEPTDWGADIMAGSLIKNPGGGIALTGGYITGREDLVKKVSYRMTAPGIGGECGLTFGQTRTMMQGLFSAPKVVNGALKGAMLMGKVFETLGYEVCPGFGDERSDIIQAVKLKDRDKMISFTRGIQKAAPIDSFCVPEPWPMPGYEDDVIMAAGAFIQGSSIELSADGPLRPPFNVYFQGGLTYEHSKFGVIMALQSLYEDGFLNMM
ncbi:MAG: methionine gamma-lyase family protein [Anaerovoracaceae bacterium]